MMHDHEVESLTCQNDTICEVRILATLSKIRAINPVFVLKRKIEICTVRPRSTLSLCPGKT